MVPKDFVFCRFISTLVSKFLGPYRPFFSINLKCPEKGFKCREVTEKCPELRSKMYIVIKKQPKYIN